MGLTLENHIDTDVETLVLINPTYTGEKLLGPTLGEIVKETETHTPQFWSDGEIVGYQRYCEQLYPDMEDYDQH